MRKPRQSKKVYTIKEQKLLAEVALWLYIKVGAGQPARELYPLFIKKFITN